MDALITLLETGDGPVSSADIEAALRAVPWQDAPAADPVWNYFVAALTGSVDAALKFVEHMLPGWTVQNLCEWENETLRARGKWMAQVKRLGMNAIHFPDTSCNHAKTAARALMASALRAVQKDYGHA